MSRRRFYLDSLPGERRGVVTLDERPEHLIIERDGDGRPRFGARHCGRIRRIDRTLGLAFLDLGNGAEAAMNLGRLALQVGQAVEVEITAEARRGKLATAAFDGPAAREIGIVRPAASLDARLRRFAGDQPLVGGPEARNAADEAESEALQVEHPLPGGGSLAIEPTRALVAVDVDQGGRLGQDRDRTGRNTNIAAIAEAARLLRLKGLGGLIVIDLIGQGQGGEPLLAAARKAFEPDQPGVVFGPLNRFGLLSLALPQRHTPIADLLLDAAGAPTPRTLAQRILRDLDREGRGDAGAILVASCAPEVAAELRPLAEQLGPRFQVQAEVGRSLSRADIRRR